ncbi:LuxR family transcriptional regulator [Emcibacter sp.]|uniref:helix-turn-helix transcriptional regulator n=1 Tax=Emcibacter sp. TaxID=1979954 RepID=UPI002AA8F3A1|nr:LuxR family transcriptional regulator [Emcibacter sp.]
MPDPVSSDGKPGAKGNNQALYVEPVERFLQETDLSVSLEQLKIKFSEALAEFDCPWFNCFSITNLDRPPSNAIRILHYPKHWVERYIAQSYFRIDPVLTEALTNHLPLIWDEELKLEKYTPQQVRLFQEAAEAGLKHFITVPIHKPGALPAVVTIARDKRFSDQSQVNMLHLLSLHLHDRADKIINRQDPMHRRKQILTPREQDCITWSAYGKTDHQIADILSISHNTAHRHLENAKRKLGAFNRAHAVSIALRLREIIL